MPSYYRERNRKKRAQEKKYFLLIAAAAVVLIALILILKGCSHGTDNTAVNAPAATPEAIVSVESSPSATAEITPVPTVEPTPEPTREIAFAYSSPTDPELAPRALTRPVAQEGLLPIFKQAETEEKIVAITVDDCFQIQNLKEIIQLAIQYDAKLTIFPIGEQVMRETHGPVLKAAWEAGMELENHTYTHNGLYNCDDATLANEIYMQNYALNYILGGEYECHFLRPRGGDARADQRIHAYCKQMDYAGIAHWTYSGRDANIMNLIEPGAIYLFHTTDTDLKILKKFIPAVAEKGYKMVTLNQMFGYDDNAFTPKEIPYEMPEVPALEAYDETPTVYKLKSYAYGVYKIQERLKELNYLADDPDGIFGDVTAVALSYFQQNTGEEVSGEATLETQENLFSENAPRYTGTPAKTVKETEAPAEE